MPTPEQLTKGGRHIGAPCCGDYWPEITCPTCGTILEGWFSYFRVMPDDEFKKWLEDKDAKFKEGTKECLAGCAAGTKTCREYVTERKLREESIRTR